MSYTTIAKPTEYLETIKASRFIVYLYKVLSVEEAQAHLADIRKLHPDANHHCWAYSIGEQYRFSDDGEPGGTAGRPMLEVLTRRKLDRIVAIVVRYFGGTKLGAGGLVRAYGGSVAKALDQAELLEVLPRVELTIGIPFDMMDVVFRYLDEFDAAAHLQKDEPSYTAEGMSVSLSLQQGYEETFFSSLTEVTKGRAKLLEQRDLPLGG